MATLKFVTNVVAKRKVRESLKLFKKSTCCLVNFKSNADKINQRYLQVLKKSQSPK